MKIRGGDGSPTASAAVSASDRAGSDAVSEAVDALRQIDRQQARLLRAIAAAGPAHGVPAVRLISLAAKATGWDVAFLSRAVDTLSAMPATWQAFDDGNLSWSQLRGMVMAAQKLRVADRERLDTLISGAIGDNDTAEPDRLVEITQDLAGRIDDLAREERERAECAQSFIRFQPTLFGGVDFLPSTRRPLDVVR